ncbi:hypothetical protein BV210_02140 [Halorientalis sp. IM1011]|nr:hypothetical protein BV210_02140 [Halorientalis sp. IM1011]
MPTVITALKTVTLVLGAMITYFSYKAYQRTGARPLGLLAFGFALVTLGSMLAGVFDLGLSLQREYAIIAETGLMALGFGVIVYSLYAR